MKGKYLMLESKQNQELLYNIADFLWDRGNEVIVQGNFCNDEYYHAFLDENPWLIVVDENDFLEIENEMKNKQQRMDNTIVHFSKTGVYTNAVPFPHKIFQFEELNLTELNRFFRWCIKLNLFSIKK